MRLKQHIARSTGKWEEVRGEFLNAQAGCCAICKKAVVDAPKLDHCHATGFIRGVLCNTCNTRLGWYETRRKEMEQYLSSSAEHAAYTTKRTLVHTVKATVRNPRKYGAAVVAALAGVRVSLDECEHLLDVCLSA